MVIVVFIALVMVTIIGMIIVVVIVIVITMVIVIVICFRHSRSMQMVYFPMIHYLQTFNCAGSLVLASLRRVHPAVI